MTPYPHGATRARDWRDATNIPIALVLGIAAVSRLLLAAAAFVVAGKPSTFATGDSPKYLQLAASIARDARFWGPEGPELFRAPGYPLLLAAGIVTGHPTAFAVVVQAALGCLTTYFVWRAAMLVLPPRPAMLAAVACAIEPGLMLWSTKIAPETMFTTCIAMAAFGLVWYLRTSASPALLVTAAGVASATYVRPVSYFLPIWLAISVMFAVQPRRRRAIDALALFAACAVLLGAWQWRNAAVAGYAGFSTQIDDVIGRAAPAAIAAADTGGRYSDSHYFERPGSASPDSAANVRASGIRAIARAPATFARLYFRGVFRTIFHPGAVPYLEAFGYPVDAVGQTIFDQGSIAGLVASYREYPAVFWAAVILTAALVPYLLLPVIALIRRDTPHTRIKWALAGIVAYFVIVSGVPTSQSRFREPMMPILAVLMGFGVAPHMAIRDEKANST